jgi:two-component system OmpR family response regulator
MPDASVLVVDDEEFIRDLVTAALRIAGLQAHAVPDGAAALAYLARERADLVVLDVRMPGVDGFEVCRRRRADGDTTPIVFLTARDAAEDRIAGFTRGGDDYVTKPFSLEELVARVQAVLRRTRALPSGGDSRVCYADLVLDEATLRVTRSGRVVELSPTEFKLLRHLMVNREVVLSKYQILDHVWTYDFAGNASVVENYISYLRKKLGAPRLIHTVRGFGYVLRSDP